MLKWHLLGEFPKKYNSQAQNNPNERIPILTDLFRGYPFIMTPSPLKPYRMDLKNSKKNVHFYLFLAKQMYNNTHYLHETLDISCLAW